MKLPSHEKIAGVFVLAAIVPLSIGVAYGLYDLARDMGQAFDKTAQKVKTKFRNWRDSKNPSNDVVPPVVKSLNP